MGEMINQYELLEPFQNKNAGFSRWTYAKKKNKDYFLKEFLNPVYPTDDSLSLELRKLRIQECEEDEIKKKKLYKTINNVSCGNVVRIHEYFRYDNHYYIATERIVGQKIPIEAMPAVPYKNRVLICKTLAYEVMNLHKAHIVHSDLKESNIIIKMTKEGKMVGKIIDFDASFFEDELPKYEDELGGDQVYLAPEACRFICGDSIKLTCKMDVFALGILFHQYLTGKMPEFDRAEYDYIFDAVLDEQKVVLASELQQELQEMINGMLECDPDKRLSMEKVYAVLERVDLETEVKAKREIKVESEQASCNEDLMGDWFFRAGEL